MLIFSVVKKMKVHWELIEIDLLTQPDAMARRVHQGQQASAKGTTLL